MIPDVSEYVPIALSKYFESFSTYFDPFFDFVRSKMSKFQLFSNFQNVYLLLYEMGQQRAKSTIKYNHKLQFKRLFKSLGDVISCKQSKYYQKDQNWTENQLKYTYFSEKSANISD